MSIVSTLEILDHCLKNKYAVGAFNLNGLDQPSALIERAEKLRSPLLITIPGVILPYVDFDEFADVVKRSANKATIPVGLHLSHGATFDVVERALKAGFTSVMYDGSSLEYEENIRTTSEAVKMGHSYNAAVEGELGAMGSSFVDISETMTDPVQAENYVKRTGVDILAVSIGNAHGFYKGDPKLDFERLEKIRNELKDENVFLTLHGGTGIPENHIKKAIERGIVKICIYTEMCVEGKKNAIRYINDNPEYTGNYDVCELIKSIGTGYADVMEKFIKVFNGYEILKETENFTRFNDVRANHDIGPEKPSDIAKRKSNSSPGGVFWGANL